MRLHPIIGAAAVWVALAAQVSVTAPLAAQATGTIVGEVVESRSLRPLQGIQVSVRGTGVSTLTNAAGEYRLSNVPAGEVEIVVQMLGYAPATARVEVVAGETRTRDFQLEERAIVLDAIVVDALTGQARQQRELANSRGMIDLSAVETTQTMKAVDVLTARVPGTVVQHASGTTGTSAPIRIRGANSLSLPNEPLIIVDGLRFDNTSSYNPWLEGGKPSRINDLNPEDIETIEVLRGPAASGLYGTAAANGVIVITTRRGRTGAARFQMYTEAGILSDENSPPANYAAARTDDLGNLVPSGCLLVHSAAGDCTQETVVSFNPLKDPRTTPYRTGRRQNHGLSVGGGTDLVGYYLGGAYEAEDGIFSTNQLRKGNLRGNFDVQVTDELQISLSTGYTSSKWSAPPDNWSTWGMLINSLAGSAFFDPANPDAVYKDFSPDDISGLTGYQDVDRNTFGVVADWQPVEWLRTRANVGLDLVSRHDHMTLQPGALPISVIDSMGTRLSHRSQQSNYTANVTAAGTYQVNDRLSSRTTIGLDYHRDVNARTGASGFGLLAGTESVSATSSFFGVSEASAEFITLGYFLQQHLGLNDRLFLTAGIRGDASSAFGTDFGLAAYPTVGVSWVVGEEPFFPQSDILSSLRFRGSYGRSGLHPGMRQARTFFQPISVRVRGADVSGVTIGGTGNADLRPEQVSEVEGGVDAGFVRDRVTVELTYFRKASAGALVNRTLPPSLGASEVRAENLAEVRNEGVELALAGRLVEMNAVEWSARVTAGTLRNTIQDLGDGVAPIIFQRFTHFLQRHVAGYPAGGYWDRPISFNDRNGDGVLSADEVTVADEPDFLGPGLPTLSAAFSTEATFGGLVRVAALFEGRFGHKQLNSTEYRRCTEGLLRMNGGCRGMWDPASTLEQQAAFIGLLEHNTLAGFVEDADFVRWRELAFTITPPRRWFANRLGASDLSITIAGRNLHTWTGYTGLDPEVNQGVVGDSPFPMGDYFTQPLVRYWTVRANVNF